MTSAPPDELTIQKIIQLDNHTFAIQWSDGVRHAYRLSVLQSNCPCAQCHERRTDGIDPLVRATRIQGVGRYALRIAFTSGCSSGIYHYTLLRTIGEENS